MTASTGAVLDGTRPRLPEAEAVPRPARPLRQRILDAFFHPGVFSVIDQVHCQRDQFPHHAGYRPHLPARRPGPLFSGLDDRDVPYVDERQPRFGAVYDVLPSAPGAVACLARRQHAGPPVGDIASGHNRPVRTGVSALGGRGTTVSPPAGLGAGRRYAAIAVAGICPTPGLCSFGLAYRRSHRRDHQRVAVDRHTSTDVFPSTFHFGRLPGHGRRLAGRPARLVRCGVQPLRIKLSRIASDWRDHWSFGRWALPGQLAGLAFYMLPWMLVAVLGEPARRLPGCWPPATHWSDLPTCLSSA